MDNYNGLRVSSDGIKREVMNELRGGITEADALRLVDCIDCAPWHVGSIEAGSFILDFDENEHVSSIEVYCSSHYFSGRETFAAHVENGIWYLDAFGGWCDGRNFNALLFALNEWLMNE